MVLEPNQHPAAKPFKEVLVADGIRFTSFEVDDVRAEYVQVMHTLENSRTGQDTIEPRNDTTRSAPRIWCRCSV